MNPYKGKGFDLGEDAIRLVQLHKGSKQAPIECTLVVTRYLGSIQGIPYEALSYTWGDESGTTPIAIPTTTPITLDGINFEVTKNLAAALVHLRDPFEDKLLWVDAICINQAHKQEKTHQVKRMRHIYESAERVIIWLGPGNENTDLFMDTACQLDQRAGVRKTWNHEWHTMKQMEPLCQDKEFEKRLIGLQDLLGRSWFQRVWIIQEVASNNRATITCGSKSVSSRTFSLLPQLMNVDHLLDPQIKSVLEVMPGTLRKTSWWQRDRSLSKLLLKFGYCEASDEKDKFYALFGISNDFNDNIVLGPDYDISVGKVIQNITWALLFGQLPGGDIQLPQWDRVTFLEALKDLPAALFKWALASSADSVLEKLFVSWGSGSKGIIGRSHSGILHRMLPLQSLIRAKSSATLRSVSTFLNLATADLVNAKDKDGYSPLHLAVLHDNLPVISLLLQHKDIEVNAGNLTGNSPLTIAVLNSHVEALSLLLQHQDIDVDFKRPERFARTPLMEAASRGDATIARALLSHPYVDINFQAEDFATSLNLAVERGHTSVVELILQHPGIMVNGSISSPNTPLNMAIARGHEKITEMLIKHRSIALNHRGASGDTALHTAVKNQRPEIVQLILSCSGVNVNCCNDEGYSPLHIAVRMDRKPEIELLLQHHAINVNHVGKHSESRTALWWAVHRNSRQALDTLLQRKDIQVHHTSGQAPVPLQLAARNGDIHLVERLIAKAAEHPEINRLPTGEDILGAALVQAVFFFHFPIVKVLLERASEMKRLREAIETEYCLISQHTGLPYSDPTTPVHATIPTSSDLDTVRLLLSKGPSVNKVNHAELTPLWRAIWWSQGDISLTKLLLEHGADPEQPVKTRTHLNLAASMRLPEICELLVQHGASVNTIGLSGISPLLAVLDFHQSRVPCQVRTYDGTRRLTRELIRDEKFVHFMSRAARNISYTGTGRLRATIYPPRKTSDSDNEAIFKTFPFASDQSSGLTEWSEVETLDIMHPTDEYETACRDTAQVLLNHGANIEAKNDQGVTTLWMAVCQNNIELVRLLLQHGADVEASDAEYGRTPLWVAALLDYGEVVDLLLKEGANPQVRCTEVWVKKTPLALAAEKGCLLAAQALLRNSEVSRNTDSISDARTSASMYGHGDLLALIDEHIRTANNSILGKFLHGFHD